MNAVRKVDDADFCITRVRRGRGFSYLDEMGVVIADKKLKRRIKKLAIPPMWQDVQICKWENGHIQAIGRDQKGRKQYIYHGEWERQRQHEKFERLLQFGRKLPKIREKCFLEIARPGWHREKVLALMVLVLDETGIRIGNKNYAIENQSYGLSTLRRRHLHIDKSAVHLRFNGKSGVEQEVDIDNRELISLIRRCAEMPGYELFRYKNENGKWHNVDSEEINEWIHLIAGHEYSSKYFRTWTATRMTVELYEEAVTRWKQNTRQRLVNLLIRMVAEKLGNTPTVCRNYYIHPAVMTHIQKQKIPQLWRFKESPNQHGYSIAEKAVLKLLKVPTAQN